MRICCLKFVCLGLDDSSLESEQNYPDPTEFIQSSGFECENIEIGKEELVKLAEICKGKGKADFYWPLFPYHIGETLPQCEILQELEELKIPLLGPSFKFMKMSEEEIQNCVSCVGIKLRDQEDSPLDGAIDAQVFVHETKTQLIALDPILSSPDEPDAKFGADVIKNNSDQLSKELKNNAIKIYQSLGVLGSGYAVVEFRVVPNGQIQFMKVNKNSKIFGQNLISSSPEGKEGFVQDIVGAKQRFLTIASTYDTFSCKYDDIFENKSNVSFVVRSLISEFNFDGTVLDLGCGTGKVGEIILAKHTSAVLTGIDLSSQMVSHARSKYSKIHVGLVENVIMELNQRFDHLICVGVVQFINPTNFLNVLSRAFVLAKKSFNLTVEDIPESYNEEVAKCGHPEMYSYNHLDTVRNFNIPAEWSLVYEKENFFWKSPHTGVPINGVIFRFERN